MLAKLVKMAKVAILRKFRQVSDEIFLLSILSYPEGSQNVGEFGKSDNSDEILPRVLTKC